MNTANIVAPHIQYQLYGSFSGGKFKKVNVDQNIFGYHAGPKDANGLLVIQDFWGVDDVIQKTAYMLQHKTGLQVLIPDMYKGKLGFEKEQARQLMNDLDFPNAVKEIGIASEYLRSKGAKKVGCLGFCLGGMLAIAAAEHTNIDASASFYGIPPPNLCKLENINIPLQGQFGLMDDVPGIAEPEAVRNAERILKMTNPEAKFHHYADTGHGFMAALYPDGTENILKLKQMAPNRRTLDMAILRLLTFLKRYVK